MPNNEGKAKTRQAQRSTEIVVVKKPDEDSELALARTVLRPTVQAAITHKAYGNSFGDLELTGLIAALAEQTEASHAGDLGRAEAMLTTQAHTLDAIFNNLAQRAIKAEYMKNLDTYLKLSLRAQSQCRATWETLAAIKNPPLMGYVRQANIAHGPQQVNNAPNNAASAQENVISQSKLIEDSDDKQLDTGTTRAPNQTDQAMATVGEINRTQDR